MIAVALSGGVDSSAAAILLHEQGRSIIGLTLSLDELTPGSRQVDRARMLCRRLGIAHHVVEVHGEFKAVKEYFCRQYLAGRTPNPCTVCNRDIKFGVLMDRARSLGADLIATGHYVRKDALEGRLFVARARELKSQEYFLGLVTQQALAGSVFPLGGFTRSEAQRIVASAGLDIPVTQSSQDVCFIGPGGYGAFIETHAGIMSEPGPILDIRGRTIGIHRGALRYTIGQRKGIGIGLGRRVYVLAIDAAGNTITVGDGRDWKHRGFLVPELHCMKMERPSKPVAVRVKVRYRQEAQPAVMYPEGVAGARVEYGGIYAPGQLAVFYDDDDAVLCAGFIDHLPGS
jgi:tRNA-uridine 2-sulfurtransferase